MNVQVCALDYGKIPSHRHFSTEFSTAVHRHVDDESHAVTGAGGPGIT
jgi:hypothetical protein